MLDELRTPAQLRKFIKKTAGKKKPKTLRQNVLHPLIITITVISIIMLIFFNVVISLILYSGVSGDLNSISATVEQLASAGNNNSQTSEQVLSIYKNELKRHSVSYRSNMIVVTPEGKIINSASEIAEHERTAVEAKISDKISDTEDKQFKIKTDDDVLIVNAIKLDGIRGAKVFIYASIRSLWVTVKWGNQALLVIIALSVLGLVLASQIVSHNISKPIKELSDHMELVGDGNFTPVNISTKDASAELLTLSNSINEMLARLQAYNDAHTKSFQNLSHDLRTPLMSISGYAEGIKYGVLDSTEDAADVIIKESRRLTEVVEKMLILSELDSLHQPVNMVPTELSSFLNDEIKRIEGYALQTNIKLEYSSSREEVTVLADSELLSTVIRNLLSNAIRYAKTEVSVKVFDENDLTYICVTDDGSGLSESDLKYLFVRYYVGKTGHSGLGLSTAKSAAEYMGCTLTGENRNALNEKHPCFYNCGAVFTVAFPKYE